MSKRRYHIEAEFEDGSWRKYRLSSRDNWIKVLKIYHRHINNNRLRPPLLGVGYWDDNENGLSGWERFNFDDYLEHGECVDSDDQYYEDDYDDGEWWHNSMSAEEAYYTGYED